LIYFLYQGSSERSVAEMANILSSRVKGLKSLSEKTKEGMRKFYVN